MEPLYSAPCMVGVSLYVLRGVGPHCMMPHYMGGGGYCMKYCMEVTMEPPCMVPHCTVGGGGLYGAHMYGGGGSLYDDPLYYGGLYGAG